MTKNFKCKECEKEFNSKSSREQHMLSKHQEKIFINPRTQRRIIYWSFLLLTLVGLIWFFSSLDFQKTGGNLPPTDMAGHIEENPPSQIMKEPMQLSIHKHMLEHAGGIEGGRGGIIINYECEKFNCEEDLVEKLESYTLNYDYVYVAPYYGMDVKIALTKLGKIKTLETYDEDIITSFIES